MLWHLYLCFLPKVEWHTDSCTCRIHKTLCVTPAVQAGVSDHVWSLEEIAALVPEPETKPRGPYKKKA